MSRASHKQWEVAILILINTSGSIKFRIVKVDYWLNLNKCPYWDSIRDPFASEANPWTAGLHYLNLEKTSQVEGFHVMSYQANFASHHIRNYHVGFLNSFFPQSGIGKHNKKSQNFSFSSYHNTKLNCVTRILAHSLGWKLKSHYEVNSK